MGCVPVGLRQEVEEGVPEKGAHGQGNKDEDDPVKGFMAQGQKGDTHQGKQADHRNTDDHIKEVGCHGPTLFLRGNGGTLTSFQDRFNS